MADLGCQLRDWDTQNIEVMMPPRHLFTFSRGHSSYWLGGSFGFDASDGGWVGYASNTATLYK